jgi:hypothetical protein
VQSAAGERGNSEPGVRLGAGVELQRQTRQQGRGKAKARISRSDVAQDKRVPYRTREGPRTRRGQPPPGTDSPHPCSSRRLPRRGSTSACARCLGLLPSSAHAASIPHHVIFYAPAVPPAVRWVTVSTHTAVGGTLCTCWRHRHLAFGSHTALYRARPSLINSSALRRQFASAAAVNGCGVSGACTVKTLISRHFPSPVFPVACIRDEFLMQCFNPLHGDGQIRP